MGQTAKVTRQNRTITVDFHNEATYDQLLDAELFYLMVPAALVLQL